MDAQKLSKRRKELALYTLAEALTAVEPKWIWGFFHVARIAEEEQERGMAPHTIEFYLYPEG